MKKHIIGLGSVDMSNELNTVLPVAYEKGYRYFDTSDDYGSETYVGSAVSSFKENIVISTKLSNPARVGSLQVYFEEQLRKVGKIDVYLMHWPYPFIWKSMYKEMEELVLAGLVPYIGVCNFTRENLEELYQFCRIKPFVLQTEISPLYQQKDVVDFCDENNLHIINYSPFAHNHKKIVEDESIKDIAKKYSQSVPNVILRWSIQRGFTPLVKTSNISRLETMNPNNLLSFSLEGHEMKYIEKLDSDIKVWPKPGERFSVSRKIKFFVIYILYKLRILEILLRLKLK